MTYGFLPDNWPAFKAELERRGIATADIEKVEIRPNADASVAREAHQRFVDVTVTMRSGRAESWRQPQEAV